MRLRHRVSRTAIELIKRFEGYRRKAARLPDGRWTLGYGHTLTARAGTEVSLDDAEALLLYDLITVTDALEASVFSPLTQNQFDALAAFVFNIGLDNFAGSSVLRRLNEGALIQAGCAMELWRKAEVAGERIVVDALVRRRAAEKLLFLTPENDAWIASPSPVLRPSLDLDALGVVPLEAPVEVTAALDGERADVTSRPAVVPSPPTPQEDEAAGPAVVAAEAVTSRLQGLFKDSPQELVIQPRLPEPEPEPEPPPAAPRTQARPFFQPPQQPPIFQPLPMPLPADSRPEPEPEPEPPAPQLSEPVAPPSDLAQISSPLAQIVEDLRGPDLFAPPPEVIVPVRKPPPSAQVDAVPPPPEQESFDPFHRPPPLPPAREAAPPEKPRLGVLSLVVLAVLGLGFFGGGVFWALSARVRSVGPISPLVVGWLAGVAGIGLMVVAVFLLLERLARATERDGH